MLRISDRDGNRPSLSRPNAALESSLLLNGCRAVAGVDEAGRGPLAGPVVAAAVVLPENMGDSSIDDSKKLTPRERDELFEFVRASARGVGVGIVDHEGIDATNILRATFRAMHMAIAALPFRPDHLLIDGNRFEECGIPFTAVVRGDALSVSVAAASIIAKVTRDRIMDGLDWEYPGYGFARHKGYPTPAHRDAIRRLGPCQVHRKSFKGVREWVLESDSCGETVAQ